MVCELAHLPNLCKLTLFLSSNMIDDEGFSHIGELHNCKKLKSLNLCVWDNLLTDASMSHIEKLCFCCCIGHMTVALGRNYFSKERTEQLTMLGISLKVRMDVET